MARELTILLKAKNAMQVGLAHAKRSLEDFGASAWRIGKFFATTFLAAGTAIAGFAVKALASFAQAQAAENSMASALQAYGDEVAVNTEKVKQFTAAIQDETGADGDALVATAARLRMLGVQTSQLESATKATVALKSAGMEEEAATKALAMAYYGNYSQLARYIPALRSANTESEKAAILADFVAKGYEQQKAKLKTVAGQWSLLKERVSDVWEEVGRAIEQNGALQDAMKSAGDAVAEFGKKVKSWVDSGGMTQSMVETIATLENMNYAFQIVTNSVALWAKVSTGFVQSALVYWGSQIVAWKNLFISVMEYAAKYARNKILDMINPFSQGVVAPPLEPVTNALSKLRASYDINNSLIVKAAQASAQDLLMVEITHRNRLIAIAEWQTKAINAQREKRVQQAGLAVAAESQLEQEAATDIEAVAVSLTDALSDALDTRKTNEATVLDEITGLHVAAAGEAKAAWNQVDPFAGVSTSRTARNESKWKPGGTVTSKGTAGTAGAGVYAEGFKNYTMGSVLGGSIAGAAPGGTNRTNEQMLEELRKIRTQQDKLLTFG